MIDNLPTPAAAPADDGEFRRSIDVVAYRVVRAIASAEAKAMQIGQEVLALIHARDARRDAALRQEIAALLGRATAAEARCAGLMDALTWYADKAEGCRKLGSIGDPARQALDADGGKRARAALNPANGAAQEGRDG